MTWRNVVYDLWTDLKQAYDDADITLFHVQYWVSVNASKLLSQHIDKRDSGAFLTVYNNVQVLIDTDNGYKYIDLPANIIDYTRDGGVVYMSYGACVDDCDPIFTSVQFTRTKPSASRILYYTEEEKPSPSNPYFYRIGNRLYLLGIECINPCGIEIGLYITVSPDICDLDEEINLPEELIPVLIRQILDLGRFVLAMPTDRINEGDAAQANVPTSKLISVNSMNQPTAADQQAMIAAQQQAQQMQQ
jgi:hypothetical protein